MNIPQDDEWAAIVINQVVSETGEVVGYIFVIDHNKVNPKWKLAGGKKDPGETPRETAVRENREETGQHLRESAYEELVEHHQWRRFPIKHWSVLFRATIPIEDVGKIHPYDCGNEGEEPKFFTLSETKDLIRNGGLLEVHRDRMIAAGCPLG